METMETIETIKFNELSEEAKNAIKKTIETHERYKNAFHWKPSKNANDRRRNEKNFENANKDYTIATKEGLVEVCHSYSESCKNVYYSLSVSLDGKKKDIRLLKKFLN